MVTFTVLSRHERSADLAQALAVLQRHKRRVGAESIASWEDAPLSTEDVHDWLNAKSSGRRLESDFDGVWASDRRFKDFEPPLKYDFDVRSRSPVSMAVEPSREELESIFVANEDEANVSDIKAKPEVEHDSPASQDEIIIKGAKSDLNNKDVSPETVLTAAKDDNLSLSSLTKEEYKALMKAVAKLQKQAIKFSEKIVETPESKVTMVEAIDKSRTPKTVTIVQPASKDELKSLFEGMEAPVVKEMEVTMEKAPDSSAERVIEKEIISNIPSKEREKMNSELDVIQMIASELRNNVATDAEKDIAQVLKQDAEDVYRDRTIQDTERDWAMRKYQRNNPLRKRTTKRAAPMAPMPVHEIYFDEDDDGDKKNGVIEVLNPELESSLVTKFVAKILQLQEEVDRLKLVTQLEDLENDVLTDALNEATLMQKEDTVSDMEFESVKQAIKIEEAIQVRNNKHVRESRK